MKTLAVLCVLMTAITACSVADALNRVLPTPTLSTQASVPVTNTALHVSFKQPEGWALIDSGTVSAGPFRLPHATYGLNNQPQAPAFRVEELALLDVVLSQDMMADTAVQVGRSRGYIVEELRETIDGLPAGGARAVGKKQVNFWLMTSQPDQSYLFTWSSDSEYLSELERIYRAMLPTIRIKPLVR